MGQTPSSRPYRDEDDFAAMEALGRTMYATTGPAMYATAGDLDWWRGTRDDPAQVSDTHLWFDDDGTLAGFAWPFKDQVDILCHPARTDREDEMLAWSEARLRQDGGSTLTVRALTSDASRRATLTRRGYARGEDYVVIHSRSLAGDLPAGELPAGYRLRHLSGEVDLEARVAVHLDAFAPSRMTVEKHRRVMASSGYRADLDLVVEAPEGGFAAFCIVWFDAGTASGLFEPVGCHSAHRRRGLATAVLVEGMRRLRDLGATHAVVCSEGGHASSYGLYTSVGLIECDRDYAWRKSL